MPSGRTAGLVHEHPADTVIREGDLRMKKLRAAIIGQGRSGCDIHAVGGPLIITPAQVRQQIAVIEKAQRLNPHIWGKLENKKKSRKKTKICLTVLSIAYIIFLVFVVCRICRRFLLSCRRDNKDRSSFTCLRQNS